MRRLSACTPAWSLVGARVRGQGPACCSEALLCPRPRQPCSARVCTAHLASPRAARVGLPGGMSASSLLPTRAVEPPRTIRQHLEGARCSGSRRTLSLPASLPWGGCQGLPSHVPPPPLGPPGPGTNPPDCGAPPELWSFPSSPTPHLHFNLTLPGDLPGRAHLP